MQVKSEKFLSEKEAVSWKALIDAIEPRYPNVSKLDVRSHFPLATILRIPFLQHWDLLSESAMEEAVNPVSTIRRFAGIELISDRIPVETAIFTLRQLL